MTETIKTNLLRILPVSEFSTALVEAGHIYAGEAPDDEVKMGLQIGVAVKETLKELGMVVGTMLFVDDYNGRGSGQETLEVIQPVLESTGFLPDSVVFEKDLVPAASQLKYNLPKVKSGPKGSFAVHGSEIIYLERQDMFGDTKYTCQALDAALYMQKAESALGGLLVTVLPASYKDQQNATKALVREAGCQAPILNVYFDKEGKIMVDFDY